MRYRLLDEAIRGKQKGRKTGGRNESAGLHAHQDE